MEEARVEWSTRRPGTPPTGTGRRLGSALHVMLCRQRHATVDLKEKPQPQRSIERHGREKVTLSMRFSCGGGL
jgi:hypothetical protein